VTEDPANGEAYSWLGFVYLRLERSNDAVPVLEKASQLRPNDLEVLINLGNAYHSTGNRPKAIATYQKITERKPDMHEAWYNIGSLQLEEKDYAAAAASLKRASELQPSDPFILNNLGAAYEGTGQLKDAAAAYMSASNMKKDNGIFARNAAAALIRVENYSAAQTYLVRAMENGESDNNLLLALGQIHLQAGRPSDALAVWSKNDDTIQSVDGYWYNVAIARERTGDARGAEEAYRRTIDQGFQVANARNNLGLMLYKAGRFAESVQVFTDLYTMNTENVGARLNLAAAHHANGNLRAAVNLWREHVRARPGDVDIRATLAGGLWQLGDHDGAKTHYQEVLKVQPNHYKALNGVGLWYLENTKLDDAEKMFRASIRANRQFAPAYNNMGVTMERANRLKDAMWFLSQAIKLDPNSKEIKDNHTRVKKRLGN